MVIDPFSKHTYLMALVQKTLVACVFFGGIIHCYVAAPIPPFEN